MNVYELLKFNIHLYFINMAGRFSLNKLGCNLLDIITNDPLLIKMHRELNKKYGKLVNTYIITNTNNYYILDTELSKTILIDSPNLFDAGIIKADFFNKFMVIIIFIFYYFESYISVKFS